MAKSILVIYTDEGKLIPSDADSAKKLSTIKRNKPLKVEFTLWSQRSLRHHQLYWGGLLKLAFDYWEPTGGLVSNAELSIINKFAKELERHAEREGCLTEFTDFYVTQLRENRAKSIEAPYKDINDLHHWVKLEAGYYDLIMTPAGVQKKPQSINFNAMDQDQFNEFYKKAFSVIWRFILSRTFKDEAEAQNTIEQLLRMGN